MSAPGMRSKWFIDRDARPGSGEEKQYTLILPCAQTTIRVVILNYHIHYKGQWLLRAVGFAGLDMTVLPATTATDAKVQAVRLVREALTSALRALPPEEL